MATLFNTFIPMAELIDIKIAQKKKYKGHLIYTIVPKNENHIGYVNVYKDKFVMHLTYSGMRFPMHSFLFYMIGKLAIDDKLIDDNASYQVWEFKGSIESMSEFLINIEEIANLEGVEYSQWLKLKI